MSHIVNSVWSSLCLVFCSCFLVVSLAGNAAATLPRVAAEALADSEEPFNRRIYSYDIQIDSQGDVHVIYSKPSTGRKANIYYVRRVNGTWQSQTLVSSDGFYDNKSTFLLVDGNDLIHVCYIKDEGTSEGLYYRVINNGSPGTEVFIDDGGWWSRMQLDDNGYPMFVRGGKKWPEPPSRLILLKTTNGTTWGKSYLNLSPVTKFLIADFIYANGTYHITYGDSQHKKLVWSSKAMTEKVWETFHNFYYVTSQDGVNWTEHLLDDSITLHNKQFWTSMVLVDGRPLVAMYKYAEYNNRYNRGTSCRLSEWTGNGWKHKIITNQIYPDTSEGMGVGLAVNKDGDYFGAWDFSPDYPQIIPGSPRGNTAMRRSGAGDWSVVTQLDPFSLEGRAKMRVHGGSLFFLALGDYTDAKLYFREFNIAQLDPILPPPGYPPPATIPTGTAMPLPAIQMLMNN